MKVIHPAWIVLMYALAMVSFLVGLLAVTFGSGDVWLRLSVAAFGVSIFLSISACYWSIGQSHAECMEKLEQG